MSVRIKKLLTIACITVVPLVIFYAILSEKGVDNFIYALSEINKAWLLAGVGCMVLYWCCDGLCTYIFSSYLKRRTSYKRAMQNTMLGQFFNAVTPFASGGQPMQAYHLVASEGMEPGIASSILMLKFIVFQTVMTVYSAIVLIFGFGFFARSINSLVLLSVAGFTLNAVIIAVCFIFCYNRALGEKITGGVIRLLEWLRILRNSEQLHHKIDDELENFYNSYMLIKRNTRLWAVTALVTFVQLTAIYSVTFCIYMGFGISDDYGILKIIAAQSFVQMIVSVVPLPGGSGGAEGSFYMFFRMLFSDTMIPVALFIWRILTYYMGLILGGLVMVVPVVVARLKGRKK